MPRKLTPAARHDRLTAIQVKAAVNRFRAMDRAHERIAKKISRDGVSLAVSERLMKASAEISAEWNRELSSAPPEVWSALRKAGLVVS